MHIQRIEEVCAPCGKRESECDGVVAAPVWAAPGEQSRLWAAVSHGESGAFVVAVATSSEAARALAESAEPEFAWGWDGSDQEGTWDGRSDETDSTTLTVQVAPLWS